jgi:type I restriction enzyme, S subunit
MQSIVFKNFVTLQRGFDLPKKDIEEGNYPVIGSTSIIGHHNEYKVEPPGVITGRSGSLGQVQYIDEPYWPHNTALWVRDFKGNHPKYVYYFLKTLDLARFNAGAGVPTLNRNHLDELEISIHEPDIQRAIADILSAYDDLIENNTRRIRILEQMAQAIYQEWFGKVNKESLPKGWELHTLGDVAENFDSKRVPLSSMKRAEMQGKYPYYGAAKIFDYVNDYIFDGKYLLMAEDGSVITTDGKPVLQMAYGKIWVNNHTHVLQGIKHISTEYLYMCLSNL